jgi:hypothetical protein
MSLFLWASSRWMSDPWEAMCQIPFMSVKLQHLKQQHIVRLLNSRRRPVWICRTGAPELSPTSFLLWSSVRTAGAVELSSTSFCSSATDSKSLFCEVMLGWTARWVQRSWRGRFEHQVEFKLCSEFRPSLGEEFQVGNRRHSLIEPDNDPGGKNQTHVP